MVPEAELVGTERGLVPQGQGWFVLNARETQWWEREGRGSLCEFEGAGFEGAADFLQLGINLTVLGAGEALAIVEGEERPLRRWDLLHCPPGTNHVIVGAGDGPCVVLAVGARDRTKGSDWGAYTVDEVAQRHGAGVERETTDAAEAYARFPDGELTRYREGWLAE